MPQRIDPMQPMWNISASGMPEYFNTASDKVSCAKLVSDNQFCFDVVEVNSAAFHNYYVSRYSNRAMD